MLFFLRKILFFGYFLRRFLVNLLFFSFGVFFGSLGFLPVDGFEHFLRGILLFL